MVEMIGGKKVIDVVPAMYFTVTLIGQNKRPIHVLVKAESAISALQYTEKALKAPSAGVHITEYTDYLDATTEPTIKVEEVANQEIKIEEKGD